MFGIELLDDSLAKGKTDSPIIVSVVFDATLGIRPQQVTQQTRVRHIRWPNNVLYLFHIFQFGAQSAMHAEDLLIYEGCYWQCIKYITEHSPEFDGVSTLAFIVEAIDTVDGGTLVVSPNAKEVFGVFDLVGKEQASAFDGLLSTIAVITQKQKF